MISGMASGVTELFCSGAANNRGYLLKKLSRSTRGVLRSAHASLNRLELDTYFTHRRSVSPSCPGLTAPYIMKGVVMQFRPSIILIITLLVLSMGLFYEAEAKTIDAGHAL